MPHVVSANRLADGIVVFLTAADAWAERIDAAAVAANDAALEASLARARQAAAANVVVDVAPVEVEVTPKGLVPRHIRERIRARGPTVRKDHGKQAAV